MTEPNDRPGPALDSSGQDGLQRTSGGKAGGRTLTERLPEHRAPGGGERSTEALQRLEKNLDVLEQQAQRLAEAISSRQFLVARSTAELIRTLRSAVEGLLADTKRLGVDLNTVAPLETRWTTLAPEVATLVAQAPEPDPHHGLDLLGLGHAEEEARWVATLGARSGPAATKAPRSLATRWATEAAPLAASLGVTAEIRADDDAQRRVEAHGTGTARGLAERGVIYLHPTRLAPGSPEGRQVLIHELMHVAQAQRNGAGAPDDKNRDDSELELEFGADAAGGDARHAAETEARQAADRGTVATPELGIDPEQAAADNDGDKGPRGTPGSTKGGERHKLKAGKDGPVFASNGLPYQVTGQGVWVIRDWVMADPDKKTTPGGVLSPSRARPILEAVGWVEPSRIEWAATHLLFSFTKRVDLLQFRTEAFQVTGLPTGTDAVASRGAHRGLDVVVALDDPKLAPGSTVAFTGALRERAVAAVANLTGLVPDSSGLEMLATEPALQSLKVGNGAVYITFDEELCDGLFGTEAYQRWAGGKTAKPKQRTQDQPKLALSNFYQQPVPGTLTHTGDPIENNEKVWFEVQVAWPTHYPDPALYRAPAMVTPGHRDNVALLQCEWEFERLSEAEPAPQGPTPLVAPEANGKAPIGGNEIGSAATATRSAPSGPAAPKSAAAAPAAPAKRGTVETAKSSVAELRHALKLGPNEATGRFRVTVRTRFDEYFAPAEFSEIVVVRSTAATMAKLRPEAFADLPMTREQRTAENFSDRTSGSGSDIHGTRTTGELPADFVPSPVPGSAEAADPRAHQRDSELQRLQAMRMYLAAQGPQAQEALEATDRELAARRAAERALADDRAKRWQPFELRGTYLAREEGLASGPLSLYGTVHIERASEKVMDGDEVVAPVYDQVDQVVVQVRDLSRRFDNNDLTFTGRGKTFDAALRDGFVDLAKAYPNGVISVLAEQIDADAVPRANGAAGPAAGRGPGTGKAIGFELGTDSRWKRAKATVWEPTVSIAVNLGAIALMTFVPGAAVVVAPVLAVYNSTQAVDRVASESARGTLSAGSFAMSVGEIALNVLPMVGRAKPFTAGWFAIETANWGGQALLMTAGALQAARELQGQDVASLAALYQELQALEEEPNGNAAALASARAQILVKAKAVGDRIEEQMWEQVKGNALVAVAGSVVHHASAQAKARMMEEFQRGTVEASPGDRATLPKDVSSREARALTDHEQPTTHGTGKKLQREDDAADATTGQGARRSRGEVEPPIAPDRDGAAKDADATTVKPPEPSFAHPIEHPIDHQAIDQQIAGPKHAQTDLHSHFMGNVPPERFAAELAASGQAPMQRAVAEGATTAERVGDVSSWEPLLREVVALEKSQSHEHEVSGGTTKIVKRATSGDAMELGRRAIHEIAAKKQELENLDLSPDEIATVRAEIDDLAKSAVEKSLRASDETDFNSSYEIRDELLKKFYGTADRHAVMGGGTAVTPVQGKLLVHFEGRPAVLDRVARAASLEAEQARGTLGEPQKRELAALQSSLHAQFAYDRYTVDTLVRLAQDRVTYTEQSNSVKKLKERFDEGQLQWAKALAKREHPELAAQLDALEVKHIAMITTNNYGARDGDWSDARPGSGQMSSADAFQQSLQDVKAMMQRGDVVGLDVAGIEHFRFTKEGQARFVETYDALAKIATPKRPLVLRPHVGEGGIDTTPGDPFARDANRQITPDGELTHYARARANIEALVESLEQITARPEHAGYGGQLPPQVIVRFGHATHTTPEQAARLAKLGVIVEVNLGSNQVTGAVAKNKPQGGQPDHRIGPGHKAPTYDAGQAELPSLDDHALATLIFNDVDVVLSTDGHEVMNTTLENEFERAERVLARISTNQQPVRMSVAQARAMNADGGTVPIPANAPGSLTIEVEYQHMSTTKQHLFDSAYRKFYESAHRYLARRPKVDPEEAAREP